MALSGAITGYSLGVVGYIPDVLPTAQVVEAISSFITLIPAVFALLSIIAIYFYPLTEERVAAIRRHSNTGSPAV
jgi:Na+/melibiose symporter-like transporter